MNAGPVRKASVFTASRRLLLAGMLLVMAAAAVGARGGVRSPHWRPTGSLRVARYHQTAILLPSGKVLVAGGSNNIYSYRYLASTELYDPKSGRWGPTGKMHFGRYGPTLTLLRNGKVLATGEGSATAELYDPRTGRWTLTGTMETDLADQTATLLPNGTVLVAGGSGDDGAARAAAEIYNPSTGKFHPTQPMHQPRDEHTATLLRNGEVLVAGGQNNYGPYSCRQFRYCYAFNTAELYDPTTGRWSQTGSMHDARWYFTATPLPNGDVLVNGGLNNNPDNNPQASAELYHPSTGKWSPTGSMSVPRGDMATATLLRNGQVLVTGGWEYASVPISTAELYNRSTGKWKPAGRMDTPRSFHTATLLDDGDVLIAGGDNTNGPLASAQLYSPKR